MVARLVVEAEATQDHIEGVKALLFLILLILRVSLLLGIPWLEIWCRFCKSLSLRFGVLFSEGIDMLGVFLWHLHSSKCLNSFNPLFLAHDGFYRVLRLRIRLVQKCIVLSQNFEYLKVTSKRSKVGRAIVVLINGVDQKKASLVLNDGLDHALPTVVAAEVENISLQLWKLVAAKKPTSVMRISKSLDCVISFMNLGWSFSDTTLHTVFF